MRLPGEATYRDTTGSELAESSGEFPDVVKSMGEARPRGVAKYSGMGEARLSDFAKYFASLSESEFLDLVEKVRREVARHFSLLKGKPFCGVFFSSSQLD